MVSVPRFTEQLQGYEVHSSSNLHNNTILYGYELVASLTQIPRYLVLLNGRIEQPSMNKRIKNTDSQEESKSNSVLVKPKKLCRKPNVCRQQSITIPESITQISRGTFSLSVSLQSISIPNSVTYIGEGAFEYCSSLQSIIIPQSVTCIGEGAFNSCKSLQTVAIPESVFAIRSFAFENCTSLESILVPNSVTFIEDSAFSYCSSLKSIALPANLMYIGRGAFHGCESLEQRAKGGINNYDCTETWLRRRFHNLPIHQICYNYNPNNENVSTHTFTMELFTTLIEENKATLSTKDAMGMTPLHILTCNPTATPDMIKTLKAANPDGVSIRNVQNMSPLMMFYACRGIKYVNADDHNYDHLERIGQGPTLDNLLKQGLQCDDLERLLAFDDETVLLSQMEKGDEVIGLYPFMTSASLAQSGLDILFKLVQKRPELLNYFQTIES